MRKTIAAGDMVKFTAEELRFQRGHRYTTSNPGLAALLRGEAVKVMSVNDKSAFIGFVTAGTSLAVPLEGLEPADAEPAMSRDESKTVAQLHPPVLYRRVVHEGWPEICTEDEFSDGKCGGQKYVLAPTDEKVRRIAEALADAGFVMEHEKAEAESAIREAMNLGGEK